MGCPADVSINPIYQRWLYQREVERSVACGQAPEIIRFGDETDENKHAKGEVEYRCRRCRRNLATSSYLIEHTPKASVADADNERGPISEIQNPGNKPKSQCAHLFFDPLSWMRPELSQGKLDGRLECPNPKCRSNIGKYAWQGMKCSCGAWVLPAISLSRSKIDEIGLKTQAPMGGLGGKI
jgi:dual specificity phosphatase 12